MPASSKEYLDIQATIECGCTLKSVCDMTKTYSHVMFCLNSLSANALLCKSLDLLNVISSADKLLTLLDILSGRFLIMFGECMLIYNGLFYGLL